jgi:hypothetical protein
MAGQQQPYSEKPPKVLGEQYLEGQPLPIGATTDFGEPPLFSDGQPRVLLPTGWVVLHLTDWVLTNDATGQPLGVVSDAEFAAHFEPPLPLQEIEGVWVCSVNTTIQNPTNGQIRLNAATVEATTIFALHKLTDANVDYSAALETAVVGDVVYIQSAKDARRWARFTLTADAARNEDAWYRVPVVWTQGSGQSFIEGNNKLLINLELSHRVDRTQVIP